jgi:hypothetical protein
VHSLKHFEVPSLWTAASVATYPLPINGRGGIWPSEVHELNYLFLESSEVPSHWNTISTAVCPSSINSEDLLHSPEFRESSNFNNS